MKTTEKLKAKGDCSPASCSRLVDLCQELIGYLEAMEESDSGRQFHPTTISSCRCMVAARLGEIIPEMKSICENGERTPTHAQ